MVNTRKEILSLRSLLIGYRSGKTERVLLPPVDASSFKGELVAVIGENGIGKSTLLRTICGLHPSLGGSVFLKEKLIEDYNKNLVAKNIGYISTEPVRVSNMKVSDLVSLGRYPHTNWTGRLNSEDHEIIEEAIGNVGLQHLTNRYINELSDGERQRAMIARVLAQDTDILVLDEPTAFLDIKGKYEIIHLLHNLSRSKEKTIVFSTHDLIIALNEADKLWLAIRDSFIEGAPEDLILDGSFSSLFSSSLVRFSNKDASFTFNRELLGKVAVEAKGIVRIWTERAANILDTCYFDSLYEMVRWLGDQRNLLQR
jgi:iron complex transport system ATP-binding protein